MAALVGAVAAFGVTVLVLDPDRSNGRSAPTSTAGLISPRSLGDGRGVSVVAQSAEPALVGVTAWSGAMPHYGSGIAYHRDGLILTTAELVDGATGIDVALADGRTASAEVVGTDSAYDLALLRADTLALSALKFAESPPTPDVGDACVLMGADHAAESPWAVEGTVTSRGRVLEVDGVWMIDMLEVSPRIPPKGVGGAALDGSGQLLGLLTNVGGRSEGGILVVPASTARRSVEQILDDGQVEHPWLGLETADARGAQLGAVVHGVDESGPAAQAGFASGDLIIRVADRPVRGVASLLREIWRREVGDRVVIRVVRDDVEVDLTVTIKGRPAR